MALKVEGSMALADLYMFDDRFTKAAAKIDVSNLDVYPTVLSNIGDRCLAYTFDGRKVEVSNHHVSLEVRFIQKDNVLLSMVKPSHLLDETVNMALRYLVGKVISNEPLPIEEIRVESPEDGKHYDTVDLVVQISSSYETMALYREYKDCGMEFKQDMGGPMKRIGAINRQEIWVTPSIHVVDGVRVLYVEATSALIEWDMITEWVKQRVPLNTRIEMSPNNVVQSIRRIRDARKEEANV